MTIKEFAIMYDGIYENDIALIEAYICQSGQEIEAISMIGNLAKNKAERDTNLLNTIRGNVCMLSLNSYRDYYPKKFADLLQQASFLLAIGIDITKSERLWERLKEEVPKHELKKGLMWRDLHELLRGNNIFFMGE